jgi:hypothetical protein
MPESKKPPDYEYIQLDISLKQRDAQRAFEYIRERLVERLVIEAKAKKPLTPRISDAVLAYSVYIATKGIDTD